MRCLPLAVLLAALALAPTPAPAQVYGSVGQPVPGGPVVPIDPVAPAVPTLPPPAVVPAPSSLIPVRPLTPAEFAASFKPLPGTYEVLFLHPKTGCPVKVCFTLKPGCIRKVCATSHKIVFDYVGQCDVVIRFMLCGKVWVRD